MIVSETAIALHARQYLTLVPLVVQPAGVVVVQSASTFVWFEELTEPELYVVFPLFFELVEQREHL